MDLRPHKGYEKSVYKNNLIEKQIWAVFICVLKLGSKSTYIPQSFKSKFPVNGVLKAMKKPSPNLVILLNCKHTVEHADFLSSFRALCMYVYSKWASKPLNYFSPQNFKTE